MLEVNLGNKTMVFGIVIALILSYGMVNFNAVQKADIAFPKASAAVRTPAPAPAAVADALSSETLACEVAAPGAESLESADAQVAQSWSEQPVRRSAPRER